MSLHGHTVVVAGTRGTGVQSLDTVVQDVAVVLQQKQSVVPPALRGRGAVKSFRARRASSSVRRLSSLSEAAEPSDAHVAALSDDDVVEELTIPLLLPFQVQLCASCRPSEVVTWSFGVVVSELTMEASAHDLVLLAQTTLPLTTAVQEALGMIELASMSLANKDAGPASRGNGTLVHAGAGAGAGAVSSTAPEAPHAPVQLDVVLQLHLDCEAVKFTLFSDRDDGSRTPVRFFCSMVVYGMRAAHESHARAMLTRMSCLALCLVWVVVSQLPVGLLWALEVGCEVSPRCLASQRQFQQSVLQPRHRVVGVAVGAVGCGCQGRALTCATAACCRGVRSRLKYGVKLRAGGGLGHCCGRSIPVGGTVSGGCLCWMLVALCACAFVCVDLAPTVSSVSHNASPRVPDGCRSSPFPPVSWPLCRPFCPP